MTNSTKTTHASIPIGSLPVDDFMLLDGAYQVSQAQVTDAVEEPPVYALRSLQLKGSEALLKKTYTNYTPESVEVESVVDGESSLSITASENKGDNK